VNASNGVNTTGGPFSLGAGVTAPTATGGLGHSIGGNDVLRQIVNTITRLESQVAAHTSQLNQMPAAGHTQDENAGVQPRNKKLTVSLMLCYVILFEQLTSSASRR
jgi:hypothetical protein